MISVRTFQYFLMTLIALLPSGNKKLKEFCSVTVEILFIWNPAYVLRSNMLSLKLALMKDLECHINTGKLRCDVENDLSMFFCK